MSTKDQVNKPRGMRAADWRGDRKAPGYHPIVDAIVEAIHELRWRVQNLRGVRSEELAGALHRMCASALVDDDIEGPDPTEPCVVLDATIAEAILGYVHEAWGGAEARWAPSKSERVEKILEGLPSRDGAAREMPQEAQQVSPVEEAIVSGMRDLLTIAAFMDVRDVDVLWARARRRIR